MSDNPIRKGGDRKSLKYLGSKNGSFLTDFLPRKDGKNAHLLEKEVVESQAKIETITKEVKLLQDKKMN